MLGNLLNIQKLSGQCGKLMCCLKYVRYLNNRISEYMTFGSVLPEGSTFPLQLG